MAKNTVKALVAKVKALEMQPRNRRNRRAKRGRARGNYNTGGGFEGNTSRSVLMKHWQMLSDPCYSDLSESAYRGQSGIVQRFTKIRTFVGTTETAFIAVYNPAAAATSATALASSATPYTNTYASDMPGNTFLGPNTTGHRCIGFCVDVEYIGTELNRSGIIGSSTVNASLVKIGLAAQTVDLLAPLIPNVTRTMDGTSTCKWSPGVGNEEYVKMGDSADILYDDAKSCLVIYGANMPPGVQVRLVETIIYEWLPATTTGIAMPPLTSGTNPVGAFEVLHNAAHADPTFAHSLRTSFGGGLANRANAIAAQAGGALVNAAVNYGVDSIGRAINRMPRGGGNRVLQM